MTRNHPTTIAKATLALVKSDALFVAELTAWLRIRINCLEQSEQRFGKKLYASINEIRLESGLEDNFVTENHLAFQAREYSGKIRKDYAALAHTSAQVRNGVVEHLTDLQLTNEIFKRKLEKEIAFEAEARQSALKGHTTDG